MGESFAHLHLHTEFSMLDGAARVNEVVAAAVADGQPAIGITDHGNMYGVLDFYKACRAQGVTLESEQICAGEQGFAVDKGLPAQQLHYCLAGGRLAAAGFADQRQRLTAGDAERNIIHRGERANGALQQTSRGR